MSVLIIFIKLIAVFDLLVIAVYFGGDILSTMLNKLRRKAKQEDSFDFSQDAVMVSLSIDSVRQLYSGDAADFVEDKILPNAEKTMAVLTDQEQAAARLLLSALIGFLAAEAPMDEQSFPMVMELLNCMVLPSSPLHRIRRKSRSRNWTRIPRLRFWIKTERLLQRKKKSRSPCSVRSRYLM